MTAREFIEENYLPLGMGLLVIGVAVLLGTGFFTPYTASTTSLNTGSVSGGQPLDYEMSGSPDLFSTVAAGGTYEYEVEVTNTGDVAYESMWIVTRMGEPDSSVTQTSDPDVDGSFYVLSCDAGTDDRDCRDSIESDWNWKVTGGDMTTTECDSYDRICTLTFSDTNIEPGETKTATIELTAPDDIEGEQAFITQPVAWVNGEQYAVAGDYDTIEAGSITGDTTLQFLGGVAAVAGAAILAIGFA